MNVIVFAVILPLLISCSTVTAQVRSGESASQRILPLPDGKMSNAQTQMQLLHRLRSLVMASEDSKEQEVPSGQAPEISDEQLEQLQSALKKLKDQLPPGIKPPDLDSIPEEQLDHAISNPAVQQQLKRMLEQFSRDGLLPKSEGGDASSSMPPLPRRRGESSTRPGSKRQMPPNEESPPKSGDKSWQSIQDAMKKLSQIAQGKEPKSSDDNDTSQEQIADAEHSESSEDNSSADSSPFRVTPQDRGGNERPQSPTPQPSRRQSGSDRRKDALPDFERGPVESDERKIDPNPAMEEPPQQSLQAFYDLIERYRDSRRNDPSSAGAKFRDSDDSTFPETHTETLPHPPDSVAGIPNQDASKGVLRRSDKATSVEPPLNTRPGPDDRAETFPEAEIPSLNTPLGEGNRARPDRGNRTEVGNEPGSSSGLIPSVSEFLKDQLKRNLLTPDKDASKNVENGVKPPASGGRENSNQPNSGSPNQESAPSLRIISSKPDEPEIDIRRELDSRGLRGTIEKLVQRARNESKAQQRARQQALAGEAAAGQAESPSSQSRNNAGPGSRQNELNDAGLTESINDLLGGLDSDIQDIVADAKFKDSGKESHRDEDSSPQVPRSEPESGYKKWNDAASGFFSELSKAPQASPSRQKPSSGSDSAAGSPLTIGSFFLAGLGLLGVLALVAICLRRPLLRIVTSATRSFVSQRSWTPGEIRSRDDVISAFHQLVVNPKRLIESWWTHRAAAQKLAAESPQQERAVRTLAEIYEQARYLPDNVELPAESIQLARTAFAECQ